MRPLLIALLLATPTASAATQVHLTYLGDAYAVTFASDEPAPVVTWEGGEARAAPVEGERDADRLFRARLPLDAGRYEIEGRAFEVRAPPSEEGSTRIAFVADIGTDANASAVVDAIAREDPDLVLIGGDLSYANGDPSLWNAWFDLMEPLAARAPMMPAFGNHEDYCEEPDGRLHACGPEANEWHAHFALPNGDALYYAFEWGPVRVTALDTEAYVHEEGEHATSRAEQEAFLRDSLAQEGPRWEIVTFHRPLRTTSERPHASSPEAREALEPILDEGGADLVLAGHLHAYERSWPMRGGEPVARTANLSEGKGAFHVTSGGGGRSLYDDWGPEAAWLATRALEYHFVLLDVSPHRIDARTLTPDGRVLDAFSLEKPAPPTPKSSPPATSAQPPTATAPAEQAPTETKEAPAPGALVPLALALLARRRGRAPRPRA